MDTEKMNIQGGTPTLKCQVCGTDFVPNRCFSFDGKVCDSDCWQEYQWIKTLMIRGKKYYPDPTRFPTETLTND